MSTQSPTDVDLLIIGGGMVGAALACACRGLDLRIALLDAQPPARDWPPDSMDLRVSALSRASQRLFERLDAWSRMVELGVSPYREMRVWEDSGTGLGRGELHFDSADLGEPDLGHIVENRVTRLALWEQLERSREVECLCPATLDALEPEPHLVRARLGDGRHLTTRLLVGADGRDSQVRTALGIQCDTLLYDQRAIVATVEPEHWHRETAWQRFLPTGPLAFLPLADGRCSIVWSAEPSRADTLLALDDQAFATELATAFDRRLGGIRAVGPRAAFPLRRAQARRYFAARAALIGDAAHAIHPLAGQGVNLGFVDAAALAEVIAYAQVRGRDLGSPAMLRRYERARRHENQRMLLAMDGLKRLFSNTNPMLTVGRGLGLSAVDRMAPLKRGFIRDAMGLSRSLPPLVRL
jgi:2-octaprenylphenol hydroxylase